jgi:hypothetical protein
MFSFDEDDVSSPHSLTVTKRLTKESNSPGGTEKVVGRKTFRFRRLLAGASHTERESCRRLRSQARERAEIQLDPERKSAANLKRKRGSGRCCR